MLGLGMSPMQQMQMRMYHGDSRISMNSTQFVVLNNTPGTVPTIALKQDTEIHLPIKMRLNQLEQKLGEKVDFFCPDGTKLSKSNYVADLLHFENFKMLCNDNLEYHIQTKYPMKKSMTPHSPAEFEMLGECVKQNMKDNKARAVTRLLTYVREAINS